MAKVYLGRAVGAGLTTDDKLFSLYLLTGRSASSQGRKITLYDNDLRTAVEPLETEEEIRRWGGNPDLLIYDCMQWEGDGEYKMVISNGKHTNQSPSGEEGGLFYSSAFQLEWVLREYGVEPDSLKTPRIGARIVPKDHTLFAWVREGEPASKVSAALDKGEASMLSTYTGRVDNPHAPRGTSVLRYHPFDSLTPEDLAREVQELADPDFFVASAAAVFDGKWKVAVNNRYLSV